MATAIHTSSRLKTKAHEDYGFFGPDSPTWKVWTYPTALTIGFQRSVVVEELDPFLLAAVNSSRRIYTNPKVRYDRTIRYFATVAVADSRSAITASEMLVRVHSKAVGIEPITGKRFDANDPESQLWIHMTGWHSVLKAYEMYGPGKLPPAEEARYWEECAIAAELQTCDPADVPRTREGVREYFKRVRPQLISSEVAQSTMQFLLDGTQVIQMDKLPRLARPLAKVAGKFLRAATVATMPRYMRELGGIRQSLLIDKAIVPVTRLAMAAIHTTVYGQLKLLDSLSPSTRPVIEPVLRKIAPLQRLTRTPSDARAEYGTAIASTPAGCCAGRRTSWLARGELAALIDSVSSANEAVI